MKYPKTRKGFQVIYYGFFFGILAMVLANIIISMEFRMTGSSYTNISRYAAFMVPSVLMTVGLYIAGTEIKKLRKALVFALLETLLALVYIVLLFFADYRIVLAVQVVQYIAIIIKTYFLCDVTADVLWAEGEIKTAKMGNLIFVCQTVFYLELILMLLIPELWTGGFLALFVVTGGLGIVTGIVVQLIFLKRCITFFGQQKCIKDGEEQSEEQSPGPAAVPEKRKKKALFIGTIGVSCFLVLTAVGAAYYEELVKFYAKTFYTSLESFSEKMLQECGEGEIRSYGPWKATCYPESKVVQFYVKSKEAYNGTFYYGFYYSASNRHKTYQGIETSRYVSMVEHGEEATWVDNINDCMGISERIYQKLFWYEVKIEE